MMNRRQMLRMARSGLVLSSVAYALPLVAAPKAPKKRRVLAGLLLPLTGPNASLGRMMERAASLATGPDPKVEAILAFDTGGTPAGAAAAAQAALKQGAGMILGPLNGRDVAPVLAAVANQVPVIAFSNDPALLDGGAFLLGITPSQAVSAIFTYARGRGVRRIGIVVGDDAWSKAALAAAERAAPSAGVMLGPIVAAAGRDPGSLLLDLRQGGDLPDAVLLPDGGGAMVGLARLLREEGVQLLGTVQTVTGPAAETAAYDGAWLAGYDPESFGNFAQSYSARHGGEPGSIAVLAYDAATIARTLAQGGVISRDALFASEFAGVSGKLRFRSDGSCVRELAILVANANGNQMVGRSIAG